MSNFYSTVCLATRLNIIRRKRHQRQRRARIPRSLNRPWQLCTRQERRGDTKQRLLSDEESKRDLTELRLDPEHIVAAFAHFYKTFETLAVEDGINASAKYEKSTFESEEQKRDRVKR
jgi:hypothetical protein